VPLPLALLLGVVVLQSVAWMVVLPPFQGPDEDSHLSYTQRIVEDHTIPWRPRGSKSAQEVRFASSKEIRVAEQDTGLGLLKGNLQARPAWTSADVALWSRADAALTPADRGGGGYVASLKNPPAYYLYQAVPYAVASGGSIFDRLMVMRLANIPLLLLALVFVWLVIGELAGRGWPQLLGTAAAAFLPQLTNVVAGITPDIAIVTEWSAALYVMLLVLRGGPRPRLVGLLAGITVLACLTHSRSLPLLVPVALTVLIALARERGWRLTPLRATLALGAAYVAVLLAVSTAGRGSVREFASYLWQFYLPKLGFMTPSIGPHGYGFREAYVDRLYGSLSWLEVVLPTSLERALWWLSVAALVALASVFVRRRAAVRRRSDEALVLAASVLALLLGLHLAAYRALVGDPADPIVTARYLLPLLPLFGAAVALIATSLPRRAAPVFLGLTLAAGVALQLESLGLLVERFYA
jgi:hypothetical protein